MAGIEVNNFGPIGQASVELKPLTVFIGPNNSGKSYLASAIYSLSRTMFGQQVGIEGRQLMIEWGRRFEFPRELVKQTGHELKKAWPSARSLPSGEMKVSDMPIGIQEVLASATEIFADSLSSTFGAELQRCYGTDISHLGRRDSNIGEAQFRIALSEPSLGLVWEMRSNPERLVTTRWDCKFSSQSIDFGGDIPPTRVLMDDPDFFLHWLALQLMRNLLSSFASRAHYMPASRSGILLTHKTLASLIVGRSSFAWAEPMEVPRLPGVITDLIQTLLLLTSSKPPNRELKKAIAFLEREIAHGTIDMDTHLEYPEFYYEDGSGKYRIHQVSSMVSEIAILVLFLKYVVRQGELLIIEEPESHLDADNQRKLARAIAILVHARVKVLITTHSDYFVNQINNLLLLSELTPKKRAAKGYAASEVLKATDVGAYLFCPGDNGSIVETLNVEPDIGIPVDVFTNVHSALYNEAVALEHLGAAIAERVPSI